MTANVNEVAAAVAGSSAVIIGLGSISPGALFRGILDMALDWDKRKRSALWRWVALTIGLIVILVFVSVAAHRSSSAPTPTPRDHHRSSYSRPHQPLNETVWS